MNDFSIDIAPVLDAVAQLLQASLIITLAVVVCGMIAHILSTLLGGQDEQE